MATALHHLRTILVTGGDGQVGFECRRLEPPAGFRVQAVGRRQLDISEPAAVAACLAAVQPAAVVNCAAYTAVDRAETDREQAWRVNRDGVALLAQGCREHGIPLVHLSTDYVFAGDLTRPYREDDPVQPLGTYGRSKEAGEAILRATLPCHLILRTAWVFGSHGHNFVKTMLRLGRERRTLRIVADQRGCPTPAAAIGAVVLSLAARAAREELPWGTYHYCGTPPVSWYAFAQEIFRRAAIHLDLDPPTLTPCTTADYPTPAPRPAYSVLDCSRIRRQLAIEQPDWRQGLDAVLAELAAG